MGDFYKNFFLLFILRAAKKIFFTFFIGTFLSFLSALNAKNIIFNFLIFYLFSCGACTNLRHERCSKGMAHIDSHPGICRRDLLHCMVDFF